MKETLLINPLQIKCIIMRNYEQYFANYMNNLDKTDKFFLKELMEKNINNSIAIK